MNIKENIRIAIFSIKTNLMRSLLTMLGIIIGVAAVIAIITLGNGGRDYIVGMIKNMGSSVINISINSKETNASDYITAEDIKAIKNLDSVAYVSQVTMSVGNVTTKHNESLGLAIAGNSDLGNMMSAGMLSGRFFTEEEYESGARVAVLHSALRISELYQRKAPVRLFRSGGGEAELHSQRPDGADKSHRYNRCIYALELKLEYV